MSPPPSPDDDEEITWEELLSHLEFGCWTAIVLIPIIYYVQGPSVSQDQLVMRSIVTATAVIGAPLLTILRRRRLRAGEKTETAPLTDGQPDAQKSSQPQH